MWLVIKCTFWSLVGIYLLGALFILWMLWMQLRQDSKGKGFLNWLAHVIAAIKTAFMWPWVIYKYLRTSYNV